MRLFEHTADIGLDVQGRTVEDLLAWAAEGLVRVWLRIDDPGAGPDPTAGDGPDGRGQEPEGAGLGEPASRHPVEIAGAPDFEALLVDWLNSLILALETDRICPQACDIEVNRQAPGDWRLSGTVLGTVLPRGLAVRPVKGATYHGLKVEGMEGGGLRARVILDV